LWKDTETLFRHTVAATGRATHLALGLTYFRQARRRLITELQSALAISDRYPEA
jgi:hypothetical protein